MKNILFLIIVLFLIDSISAQHKTLTLYYPDDSTNVISISELDSMSIFICGVSKVRYGGKDYNTVLIGDQCWLKENLDVGDMILGTSSPMNNGVIEKYCYNDNPVNCNTYGGLYQWDETMQYVTTEGARGICPTGWHIPTIAEFGTLKVSVNNNGNSLKAIGQGSGNGAGTDTSGFSALLGGNRETNGSFIHITYRGHFWSSSLGGTNLAHHPYLWNDRSDFSFHVGLYPGYGFNVRCIKD